MKAVLTVGGQRVGVEITTCTGEILEARVDGTAYRVRVSQSGDSWRIALPDRTLALTVVRDREQAWVAVDGEVYRCAALRETETASASASTRTPRVTAPMPGKVLEVLVREGQEVALGDALVVLEAMKMETVATAEAAARVVQVHVTAGVTVEPGQALVDLQFT